MARGRDEVLLSVAGEGKALHFGRRLGTLPVVNYEVEIADEAKAKLRSMPKEIRRAKAVLRELHDALEDLEDRRELAAAKKRNAGKPGTPWGQAAKKLGI